MPVGAVVPSPMAICSCRPFPPQTLREHHPALLVSGIAPPRRDACNRLCVNQWTQVRVLIGEPRQTPPKRLLFWLTGSAESTPPGVFRISATRKGFGAYNSQLLETLRLKESISRTTKQVVRPVVLNSAERLSDRPPVKLLSKIGQTATLRNSFPTFASSTWTSFSRFSPMLKCNKNSVAFRT